MAAALRWHAFAGVAPGELCLQSTLANGQCFGWKRVTSLGGHDGPAWVGVVGRDVVGLRQLPSGETHVADLASSDAQRPAALLATLADYFQLSTPLAPLYKTWSSAHAPLKAVAARHPGMRVLRQDPLECLFSFICSSNNNIARITMMLDKLRITFGELLHVEERTSGPSIAFHRFPTIKELAGIDEAQLRAMSFGYRAKFIVQTAAKLDALGGEAYLYSLRGKDHQAVQEALLQFTGVGRKVADCVALFSLDQTCAVPVDTHVWQIAKRDFAAASSLDSSTKTLTPKVYQRIHEAFSSTFGPHAGWAHCLLFAAELPSFSGEDARTKKGGKKKRTTGESESGCTKAHKPTAKRAGGVKVEAGTTERATKAGKGKNVASKLDTKGTRASVKNEGAGASQPATPRAAAGTKRKRKVNGTNREVSKTSSNRGAGQATQRKPQETKGRRVSKRSAQASAVATPSEDSKSKPKPKRLRQATKATT
eukprot:m.76907 g.76907  ORF g.76907 m.76907 type:complete len:481 (-) comp14528_c5_seq2:76-1518(-)